MLRDRELLDEQGGLGSTAELTLPDSIQALITARLDTLPLERKTLLRDAAVMGKVFWASSVSAMSGYDEREVAQAFMIQGDAKSLIELFRAERDPGLKRVLLQQLTLIDEPEANRFLLDLLGDEQ